MLGIGVVPTDLGTGFWTQRIDPRARVMIDPDGVQVRYHRYDGLPIAEVVAALLERLPAQRSAAAAIRCPAARPRRHGRGLSSQHGDPAADRPGVIRVAEVIAALQDLDQSRYSFVADVGDSWFIGLELRADVFVAAGYYSSMGFAVPAALGAGIAEPSRRPLVIVGDGAFQMTGTELATLVDQGLRPDRAAVEQRRLWHARGDRSARVRYYERRNWDYPALARPLGAEAERVVERRPSCARRCERAEAAPGAYLIEAFTARDDLSPVMARIRTHVHSAFRINAAA